MKKKPKDNSFLNRLLSNLQTRVDSIYQNTYFNSIDNDKTIENIKTDLDNSLDNIINNNMDNVGQSNISKVYSRLIGDNDKNGGKLEDLFSEKMLSDTFSLNYSNDIKNIQDYDEQIDILCQNMPQLQEALNAKKDSVLSADHYSTDFLNAVNLSSIESEEAFKMNIDMIKEKYNLVEQLEICYDNVSKYGEQFIYIIPYKDAFNKLLNKKGLNTGIGYVSEEVETILEASFENISISVNENGIQFTSDRSDISYNNFKADNLSIENECNINVQLNFSSILESAIKEKKSIDNVFKKRKFNKTLDDNIEFEFKDSTGKKNVSSKDGLINISKNEPEQKIDEKIPGCVFKLLDRARVIPIYIDTVCLGYYYVEFQVGSPNTGSLSMMSPMLNTKGVGMNKMNSNSVMNATSKYTDDMSLQYIANKLASLIDSKFINANQDLSEEIYNILKINDLFINKQNTNIKVTYISPNNMIHMYFKKDPTTNRGISDLDRSLIPAKLYTGLYVTNTIGILTRGQDKRVYYVKQNVDTNISQTLLNTINQIKKSNFGARELLNIKNVLGITGRFNDFLIPMGPSGDAPVNFEVMQGQDIDPHTDLMEQLEKMAISATDVPYEYIQGLSQVDFATRLTISNGKFVRIVFKRQNICERIFSKILTILYDTEFGVNDKIHVKLPPPSFLNLNNTNSLLQNINDFAEQMTESEMPQNMYDELDRVLFKSKIKRHYLATYIDTGSIDTIKKETLVESSRYKDANGEEQE